MSWRNPRAAKGRLLKSSTPPYTRLSWSCLVLRFFVITRFHLKICSSTVLKIIDLDKFEQTLSFLEGGLDVHVAGMFYCNYTKGTHNKSTTS